MSAGGSTAAASESACNEACLDSEAAVTKGFITTSAPLEEDPLSAVVGLSAGATAADMDWKSRKTSKDTLSEYSQRTPQKKNTHKPRTAKDSSPPSRVNKILVVLL